MEAETRMRLKWVGLYERTGKAGLSRLRCGIFRPALGKRSMRPRVEGPDGTPPRSVRGMRVYFLIERW